jgi:hypothetical protein
LFFERCPAIDADFQVCEKLHELSADQFVVEIQHQIDGMSFACVHCGGPL